MAVRFPRRAHTLATATAVASVLAGCTAERGSDEPEGVDGFLHLHGLHTPAWAEGNVYVATHEGLIVIDGDRWTYVSEEPHDFMGFTAHPTEPDVLFSSGHPAPGSGLPNPLGFMRSTDSGATWEPVSLHGEVDFHALTVGAAGASVYGFDSHGGPGLLVSLDGGSSWEHREAAAVADAGGVYSLAADPEEPGTVWAGTPLGLLGSVDHGTTWDAVFAEGPVTAVAVAPVGDRVAAYAPGVGMIVSDDGGRTWQRTGWMLADGEDAVGYLAVDPADPDVIWAGTFHADLYRSADGGATWETRATAGKPTR